MFLKDTCMARSSTLWRWIAVAGGLLQIRFANSVTALTVKIHCS
jgi:hypothetical protein